MQNNQKSSGCAGTLVALALLFVGGAGFLYVAPHVERYQSLPSIQQQLQQFLPGGFHPGQNTTLHTSTGETFLVTR